MFGICQMVGGVDFVGTRARPVPRGYRVSPVCRERGWVAFRLGLVVEGGAAPVPCPVGTGCPRYVGREGGSPFGWVWLVEGGPRPGLAPWVPGCPGMSKGGNQLLARLSSPTRSGNSPQHHPRLWPASTLAAVSGPRVDVRAAARGVGESYLDFGRLNRAWSTSRGSSPSSGAPT